MTKLKTIHSAEEIPDFASEAEEHAFWSSHAVSEEMLQAAAVDPETQAFMAALPTRAPKAVRVTSIRLDQDLEKRLKAVAAHKHVPYQTMLKDFVRERLYEEEKRLKIV